MTKHLHAAARRIQTTLLKLAGDRTPPLDWAQIAPLVLLDAWSTLVHWHRAGEPISRLTDAHCGSTRRQEREAAD